MLNSAATIYAITDFSLARIRFVIEYNRFSCGKMLSRRLILAAAPLAKKALASNGPATAAVFSRLDHHGPPADYKHPTMDELHVPCGPWKENYDNYQRKYNVHLIFGIGFFTITLISCIASGYFNLYLFAPEKPGPRNPNLPGLVDN